MPNSRTTGLRRTSALLAVGAASLAIAACGESDQEKAQSQVCDARADIGQQVDDLKGMTASTVSLDGVKDVFSAIGDDLQDITSAQGDLSDERRQQVETAVKSFGSEVKSVASEVVQSLSASDAKAQLTSAVTDLENGLRTAFEPVDCE